MDLILIRNISPQSLIRTSNQLLDQAKGLLIKHLGPTMASKTMQCNSTFCSSSLVPDIENYSASDAGVSIKPDWVEKLLILSSHDLFIFGEQQARSCLPAACLQATWGKLPVTEFLLSEYYNVRDLADLHGSALYNLLWPLLLGFVFFLRNTRSCSQISLISNPCQIRVINSSFKTLQTKHTFPYSQSTIYYIKAL